MLGDYAIHIRNRLGEYRQRLVDIESVEILEVLNDPGSWTIKSRTPYPCPFVAGDGITVSRKGSLYYTGIMKSIQEDYDAYDHLYTWTVSGASDLDFLTRRVCYPDPSTGLTTAVSHYEDAGTLSEVVKRLIDRNLGPDAMPARQEPLVKAGVIDDPGVGVTVSLRFQNLLEAIQPLLDAQNFAIRANWDNTARKIYYQVYEPLSYNEVLLFSAGMNSVLTMTYISSSPEGNAIISGGEGEQTARAFAYATDDDSVSDWGRIEYFHDMRSTDAGDLQADADSTLQKYADENSGNSAMINTDAPHLEYKTDWNIGDFVAIAVHNDVSVKKVLQVKTTITYDEETIEPTIGTVNHGQLAEIFARLSQLRGDVDQLQWGTN